MRHPGFSQPPADVYIEGNLAVEFLKATQHVLLGSWLSYRSMHKWRVQARIKATVIHRLATPLGVLFAAVILALLDR